MKTARKVLRKIVLLIALISLHSETSNSTNINTKNTTKQVVNSQSGNSKTTARQEKGTGSRVETKLKIKIKQETRIADERITKVPRITRVSVQRGDLESYNIADFVCQVMHKRFAQFGMRYCIIQSFARHKEGIGLVADSATEVMIATPNVIDSIISSSKTKDNLFIEQASRVKSLAAIYKNIVTFIASRAKIKKGVKNTTDLLSDRAQIGFLLHDKDAQKVLMKSIQSVTEDKNNEIEMIAFSSEYDMVQKIRSGTIDGIVISATHPSTIISSIIKDNAAKIIPFDESTRKNIGIEMCTTHFLSGATYINSHSKMKKFNKKPTYTALLARITELVVPSSLDEWFARELLQGIIEELGYLQAVSGDVVTMDQMSILQCGSLPKHETVNKILREVSSMSKNLEDIKK